MERLYNYPRWRMLRVVSVCPTRRSAQLIREGALKLATVRHFVLDECDKMLESE